MELQSYDECVENRGLFKRRDLWGGWVGDGMFYSKYDDGSFDFCWYVGGVFHRLDGPAFVIDEVCGWYFLGELVEGVKSQKKFEEWLVSKL